MDKVRNELNEVTLIERRLETKAWGAQATQFLKTETTKQHSLIEEVWTYYLECKDVQTDTLTIGDMKAKTKEINDKVEATNNMYKEYARDTLGQFSQYK